MSILDNHQFARLFERLASVGMNPRRHTASDVREHSRAAAALAMQLAIANGCTPEQVRLMSDLGLCHDIGKVDRTSKPEHSVDLLASCGVTAPELLALVRWHDTGLPWYRSLRRGEAPTDKAWSRLAREVDVRLLCMFMVSDRLDAPGGWRRNAPTVWFIEEVRRRRLTTELQLDLPDHPSIVDFAGVVVLPIDRRPRLLVVRDSFGLYDLPTAEIGWDELPEEAACRAVREGVGFDCPLQSLGFMGQGRDLVENGDEHFFKLVRCCRITVPEITDPNCLAECAHWVDTDELDRLPLAIESLGPVMKDALGQP